MKALAHLILTLAFIDTASAQAPAIPDPPLMLLGTVTDASNNQPVTITSIVWQVSDGTANKSFSAASLPATRVVDDSGQSFYLLEVPFEVRSIQSDGGPVTLTASKGFNLQPASPTYTLTAVVNGIPATIRSVSGTAQPAGTSTYAFNDCTPSTQGRMLRVDLNLNETPYSAWAAGYFPNLNAPETAPGYDYDGDGFTNEQERLAGTDPSNGESAMRFIDFSRTPTGESVSITWSSVPGKTYGIESSLSLQPPDWLQVGDTVTASGLSTTQSLPNLSSSPRRFFRVRLLP